MRGWEAIIQYQRAHGRRNNTCLHCAGENTWHTVHHIFILQLFISVHLMPRVDLAFNDMPPLQEHKYRSSSKASDNGKTSSSTDREGVKHNSSSSSNSGNREKSRDKSKSEKERHTGSGGSSSKHRNKDREKDKSSYPSSSSLQGSSPSSASKVSSKVRCRVRLILLTALPS